METLCPTSVVSNSRWVIHQGHSSWTKEENKLFESALAIFDEKTPNRWFKVAAMIPGKSVYDVINQYRELVADVSDIEAGLVPIPGYFASSFTLELSDHHRGFDVFKKRPRSSCDQERKKGVPWTEDEHRRFLLGLQKHGKGDWRSISRNFVISKTPTQVASHAQKYYLRQLSGGKDKRRPSIHDITTVDLSNPPSSKDQSFDKQNQDGQLVTSHVHNSTNSKIVMDWNQYHKSLDGTPLVVLDCDSTFVAAYPHDIVAKHIFNINAASNPGRFYG